MKCKEQNCGRPVYALGLCQTHHRQLRTEGTTRPIRPYRKRSPGTVKFAGLRVTPGCARTINRYAQKRGLSLGAAITEVLEDWNKRRKGGSRG
jgi:hypothetical protein